MKLRWFIPAGLVGSIIIFAASVDSAPPRPQADDDAPSQKEQLSYGVGFYLGREVAEGLRLDGINADMDLLVRGFTDGLMGAEPMLPADQFEAILFAVHDELQARMVARRIAEDPAFKELHDNNLLESRAYHLAHANEEGVVTLDNGIQYKVLQSGDGLSPTISDTIIVTFRGELLDGTVFNQGENIEVEVNDIVGGAAMIVQMMQVGDKWHVALPPEQAYGAAGDPPRIGPNETLLGTIELVGIK